MEAASRVPASVWLLTAGLAVLIGGSVLWGVDNETNDLTDRATTLLAEAGIPIQVVFDGRDAYLSGTVETHGDVDAAERLVTEMRGVRTVDAAGIVVATEHLADPAISITRGATTIVAGVVPDPAAAEGIVAAVATLGEVANNLTINADTAEAPWLAALPDVLSGMDGWRTGSLVIDVDGITIEGTVDSQAVAETITANLAQATRLDVTYDLRVVENRTPTFSAVADEDQVALDGELHSQALIDEIAAAAAADGRAVVNRLRQAPVAEAPWTAVLPEMIDRLEAWPVWSVSIAGGSGEIVGRAPSSAAANEFQETFLDRIGIAWEGRDLEVSEEALAAELTSLASGTINFESASAVLDEESLTVLDGVAELLLANPSAVMIVEGHTDDEGGESSNLALSQERAEAVVDYLIGRGIDPGRLSAIGYGEGRPIAENGTPLGRAQNRRIEFVVEES